MSAIVSIAPVVSWPWDLRWLDAGPVNHGTQCLYCSRGVAVAAPGQRAMCIYGQENAQHKFQISVTFDRPLSRAEAMIAARNSGHMGPGSHDYFSVARPDHTRDVMWVDGEMKVMSMKYAKEPTP